MRKMWKVLLLGVACLVVASSAWGKDLVIGVGNFAPYYVEADQSGVHLDLIKAAFTLMPQYTVKFKFMTNDRLLKELLEGTVDASANMANRPEVQAYFLSVPFFRFQNVAVSLKKKNLVINTIGDLQNMSIATYQGANVRFGEEFKKMAETNANYKEYPNQLQTGRLLIQEKADVRIGDVLMFWYQLTQEFKELTPAAFTIHNILTSGPTHLAFRDQALRDEFNKTAEKIMTDGTYDAIYQKYNTLLGVK